MYLPDYIFRFYSFIFISVFIFFLFISSRLFIYFSLFIFSLSFFFLTLSFLSFFFLYSFSNFHHVKRFTPRSRFVIFAFHTLQSAFFLLHLKSFNPCLFDHTLKPISFYCPIIYWSSRWDLLCNSSFLWPTFVSSLSFLQYLSFRLSVLNSFITNILCDLVRSNIKYPTSKRCFQVREAKMLIYVTYKQNEG